MLKKRFVLSSSVTFSIICLILASAPRVSAQGQIIVNAEEILKSNPLPAGEKVQTIKLIQDETATVSLLRITEGVEVKGHLHKTHSEAVICVKGKGQMQIGGKWVDLKSGSLHFNAMGNPHAAKNTGTGEWVIISIFTPAMKEPDRHPVP